jgi:hypothetical protein
MFYRPSMAVCALLIFTLCAGCTEPKPEFAAVEGIVTFNGQPEPGLVVNFSPIADAGNTFPSSARGITDSQGKYSLNYEYKGEEGPGAAIGAHRVTIIDTKVGVTLQGQTAKPPKIPYHYADISKTPLTAEVKAGETNNIPLQLKK